MFGLWCRNEAPGQKALGGSRQCNRAAARRQLSTAAVCCMRTRRGFGLQGAKGGFVRLLGWGEGGLMHTWPVWLCQARQGVSTGSPRDLIQRRLPRTGTMPSTSPENTQITRSAVWIGLVGFKRSGFPTHNCSSFVSSCQQIQQPFCFVNRIARQSHGSPKDGALSWQAAVI
jgi:hypothetical protein